MDLKTIEMDQEAALEEYRKYSEAIRTEPKQKYSEARSEYERFDRALARGYKELAKGSRLIRLTDALRAGGTQVRTWTYDRWSDGRWVKTPGIGTFPRLAVARADARHCMCSGLNRDGDVTFWADGGRRKADKVSIDGVFGAVSDTNRQDHKAIVPTIPPMFRPPFKLSNYHLLWEAEWDLMPPVDPALLKHLAGDLYVLLAVWDLTELEQAVLSERANS